MPESLISIIVPVYNLEKYIERCVSSLLNLTYRNVEVILIDDGSDDGSSSICDELANVDNRVRVFHISNSGVSFARNYALDRCKGEYIVFVDGDDWLDTNWLERAFKKMQNHQADVFAGGFICDYDDGTYGRKNSSMNGVLSKNECINKIFLRSSRCRIFPWSVCGKLFQKDLWNNIRFDEKLHIGEDALAFFDVLLIANRIAYDTDVLYHYYQRRNSVTHKTKLKHILDYLTFHERFLQKIKHLKDREIIYCFECRYKAAIVRSVLKMYQYETCLDTQTKLRKMIRSDIYGYLKAGWMFEKCLGVVKVILSCCPDFCIKKLYKKVVKKDNL